MNALTRSLEAAFIKHAVPFQIVKGLAFFDRKENKDILANLRLLVNPQDNLSFLRAVNEPPRGIGKVSLERLQAFADEHEIRVRGHRIVYMIHEQVGHLGIFVSSSIAKKEHTEVASTMKTIEALAPGLYEMTIE